MESISRWDLENFKMTPFSEQITNIRKKTYTKNLNLEISSRDKFHLEICLILSRDVSRWNTNCVLIIFSLIQSIEFPAVDNLVNHIPLLKTNKKDNMQPARDPVLPRLDRDHRQGQPIRAHVRPAHRRGLPRGGGHREPAARAAQLRQRPPRRHRASGRPARRRGRGRAPSQHAPLRRLPRRRAQAAHLHAQEPEQGQLLQVRVARLERAATTAAASAVAPGTVDSRWRRCCEYGERGESHFVAACAEQRVRGCHRWVLHFSPRVGHLHAGCAKDVTVTFRSAEPRYLRKELAQCALTKITFDQPVDEVTFGTDFKPRFFYVCVILEWSLNHFTLYWIQAMLYSTLFTTGKVQSLTFFKA